MTAAVALFTYESMLAFAQGHSYFLIFPIMVIEGPMITTAAAFAASLGYFNIFVVFLLSVLGDLVGDALHFSIGRVAREPFIRRYGHVIGFDKKASDRFEKLLRTNLAKTLFLAKLTPVAGMGILLAGAHKVPWRKFVFLSLIITLPRTLFFTSVGFFFGWAISSVFQYLSWGSYAVFAVVLVLLLNYLFIGKITKRLFPKR